MSEKQYVLNMIDKFATPGAVFAIVADSFNVFKFCEMLGDDPEIREKIEKHGKTGGLLVIRPDSGDPVEVIPRLLQSLDKNFGSITNEKGYKVLNNVRLIWGDGINKLSIRSILRMIVDVMGFSADNIAFGMGGALLQIVNRDDLQFAMKCSSAFIGNEWVDVFKDPITDKGKKSLAGLLDVFEVDGKLVVQKVETLANFESKMKVRYMNGELKNQISFVEVRENCK
jgi:nicotinamide phosphoribosyltransferase